MASGASGNHTDDREHRFPDAFQIPGIGYTSYQAVLQGDIPFVMFYMLFSAVLILLGNLIADILYAVVDPRVRVN